MVYISVPGLFLWRIDCSVWDTSYLRLIEQQPFSHGPTALACCCCLANAIAVIDLYNKEARRRPQRENEAIMGGVLLTPATLQVLMPTGLEAGT